ncbi:MAG: hypothetical protein ACJ8C4_00540 [Gemmataceae bacterium]
MAKELDISPRQLPSRLPRGIRLACNPFNERLVPAYWPKGNSFELPVCLVGELPTWVQIFIFASDHRSQAARRVLANLKARGYESIQIRVGLICRVCGCTDDDCKQCIRMTGRPCHWVEPDLCSACVPPPPPHKTKPRRRRRRVH